jgi:choline dehydrogenase-like flavoprotein
MKDKYDDLIVSGGYGGWLVAACLSENLDLSVDPIEAGPIDDAPGALEPDQGRRTADHRARQEGLAHG